MEMVEVRMTYASWTVEIDKCAEERLPWKEDRDFRMSTYII
jgi:hypothetical protein